jgi:hypothetical protein
MSDAVDRKPELQADTLELINMELTALLARQAGDGVQIDTKAAVLIGYIAAASSFLASRHSQPVLTVLAFAAYAAAAGFGIAAYAVGDHQDVPEPRHLFNNYATHPKTAALAALAARRVGAYESNAPRLRRKVVRWRWSLAALVAGAVFMFAALYVQH